MVPLSASHEGSQASSSCEDVDTPCSSVEGDSGEDGYEDNHEDEEEGEDNADADEDDEEEGEDDDDEEEDDEEEEKDGEDDGSNIVAWMEGVYTPGLSQREGNRFETIDLLGF